MDISKYCFTLEALDRIILPEYKGSAFHGGFGRALSKISPTWYEFFFRQEKISQKSVPNPYVLLPPLDTKQNYYTGTQFQTELTLFGEATQHSAICQAAIEYLGSHLGLGYQNGKYKVVNVQSFQYCTKPTPDNLSSITVHTPTRIRLKHKNRLCRSAPDFAILTKSLINRAEKLYNQYEKRPSDLPSEEALISRAKHIRIKQHHLKWDDWDRFSGNQKQWMKFGGLKGDITYSGDLTPFYELLKLGEWMYVGGKTSFGLGKYELEINNA